MLAEAHALKEGFLSIWDQRDRPSAQHAYEKWLGNIPPELQSPFKELTTAMKNWHEEVFNYFEQPITNAYTEAVNGLAKLMNRMGRGYSFEVIRARLLYDAKARKDGSVVVREADPDDGFMMKRMAADSFVQARTRQRTVEYGPYIPTLIKLLNQGHFE